MTDSPRLDARQAGRSPKLGRPFGARDRFPRGTKDAERAKLLEAENANLRRLLADFEAERAANEATPARGLEVAEWSVGPDHPRDFGGFVPSEDVYL